MTQLRFAQQVPIPGEGDEPVAVTIERELTLGELTHEWTLAKDWDGESSGFDDIALRFSNWLSGLPGDAERFLEESANMGQPIRWATLAAREKVVARGVATAL